MKEYILGLDIGGTKCAVVLGRTRFLDEPNNLIADKCGFPTEQPRGWQAVTEDFFRCIDLLLERNGICAEELESIGISCGGPLCSKTGVIKCPPNLPDWDNVPITDLLFERYGVPAFLQNDANACALAEWKFGAGRGYNNMIFLTFGTGMGAGLILDGRLYSGTNDMAGEVGHMRLAEDGPVGYGKRGSFEGFCSGGGIARLAEQIVYEKLSCGVSVDFCRDFASLDTLTAKSVALAAAQGDETATEIYNICGKYLGKGLAVLIDILNPQAIVIGSIYERSGELLRAAMAAELEKEALPDSLACCKILAAQLGDRIGDFAALGAAIR